MDDTRPESRIPGLLAVLALLLMTLFALRGALDLPFSGAETELLLRLDPAGPEAQTPLLWQTFRPVPQFVAAALQGAFGVESATPYRVTGLVLHALCTLLVYLLGMTVWRSRLPALVGGLLFATGGGVVDGVTWLTSIDHTLATLGGLVALLGLARWWAQPGPAAVLIAVGACWQALCTADSSGTAVLCMTVLLAGVLTKTSPRPALANGLVMLLGALWLAPLSSWLDPVAAPALEFQGWGDLVHSARTRLYDLGLGFGLSELGWIVCVTLGLLTLGLRRSWVLAGVGLLYLVCTFIPSVLAISSPPAHYPTQAPLALLLGALPVLVLGLPGRERAALLHLSPMGQGFGYGLACALALFASDGARNGRIERWDQAMVESRVVSVWAQTFAAEDPLRIPALVNLEVSSQPIIQRALGLPPDSKPKVVDFLDAATGYVEPSTRPQRGWFGRRYDGIYDVIDPKTYFETRPAISPCRLYGSAQVVHDFEDARERLRSGRADISTEVVVELPPGGALSEAFERGVRSTKRLGEVEILEEFTPDLSDLSGQMVIGVEAERVSLLVLQMNWMYESRVRISPERAVATDAGDRRPIAVEAIDRLTGTVLKTYPANGMGTAVLLPPGTYEVDLYWFTNVRQIERNAPRRFGMRRQGF